MLCLVGGILIFFVRAALYTFLYTFFGLLPFSALKEATKWYNMAAKRGNKEAQMLLSHMGSSGK